MTMSALRVRRLRGVSAAGSALTPSSAGVPEECEEEHKEEEEEEEPNLLGAHCPSRRRCAGAAALIGGYVNGGLLPPSLMTMPALRVRWPSGVSAAGSALTRNSAGEPEEWEEEREED